MSPVGVNLRIPPSNGMKRLGPAAVSLRLLLGTAAVAQADDQAFLDQIPPRNYFSMWQPDSGRLVTGHRICDMLHSGSSPESLASQFTVSDGWAWVNAAQRELCPDTLTAGGANPAPASDSAAPGE